MLKLSEKFNLKYGPYGLIPVITQDEESGKVLMMAYMNEEAVNKTVDTGLVHYYSRTRRALWLKGETSGHYQHVSEILVDCDRDTLLIKVHQEGIACHTGNLTCFYRKLSEIEEKSFGEDIGSDKNTDANAGFAGVFNDNTNSADIGVLNDVYNVIKDRKIYYREGSYTSQLFAKGLDRILKKVGEEAAEVIIAAKNKNNDEIRYEAADLIYHLMVMMVDADLTWEDIFAELKNRQ